MMSSPLDLPLGHQDRCQICSSARLELVCDLGHQPPCDSLLTPAQIDAPEQTYPLRFLRCIDCGLAQIDFVVEPDVLFHPGYPYRSGITPSLVTNLRGTAHTVTDRFGLGAEDLAVDIGSNDGTLLKGFQERGVRTLGVEATNVAQLAVEADIDTVQAFFDEPVAHQIRDEHGPVSAVTATNMFAHVQRLGELIRGVHHLLDDGGVFVTESHYLLDLLETLQFDSIYHEHLKFYSLRPLIEMFAANGFTVVDVDRIPNYGGSIRVYAIKGSGTPSPRVGALLALEEREGLYGPDRFRAFAADVRTAKLSLQRTLVDLADKGAAVAGIGCPGRASTLLNYCNIDPDLMPYIAEQSSSLKLGLHLPGVHIPVVDERILFEEPPEYAVMLSWHYAAAITERMRDRGLQSKVIVPLPHVRVLEA